MKITCSKGGRDRSTVVEFECTNDFAGADMTDSLSRRLDRFSVDYASVAANDNIYTVTLNCESAQKLHEAKLCIENCSFFKRWVTLSDSSKNSILSSTDTEDLDDDSPYLYLGSKQVLDSDGFYTDYTLYLNTDTGNYICMFGDNDVYGPDEDYADFVTDSRQVAFEWYDHYDGFADEEFEGEEDYD